MNELVSTILFGATILALVLGLSCIVMGVTSNKQGAEALRERIEYGFFGVSGLALTVLLAYASS